VSRYVVCYDISSNSARTKVMKRLKNKGFHAQLSFFELSASSSGDVRNSVIDLLDPVDRFAVIRLSSRGKIKRLGSLFEGMGWVL